MRRTVRLLPLLLILPFTTEAPAREPAAPPRVALARPPAPVVAPAEALRTAPAGLQPVPYAQIPGWEADSPLDAIPVILGTCRHLGQQPQDRALGGADAVAALGGTPASWKEPCAALARAVAELPELPRRAPRNRVERRARDAVLARRRERARDALERIFIAHAAGDGLLTGYFEPILRGSLSPGAPYLTPLHARPPELAEALEPAARGAVPRRVCGARPAGGGALVPLATRGGIEEGALNGRGLELAWVDDAAAAFFLHIQGSGRVMLPDGAVLRLGYAGQNGQPYRAIGRSLIERGALTRDQMSMRAIVRWMNEATPEEAAALRRENPSYIFFRRNEGLREDQGPPGALGIPLTPERSIAVDPAFIPLGAPVFVAPAGDPVPVPVEALTEAGRIPPMPPAAPLARARRQPAPPAPPPGLAARLTVAQDTGGAIRGPARGDLFRGWGDEAGERAGRLRDRVLMWVLLPRPADMPLHPPADPAVASNSGEAPPRLAADGPRPSGTPAPAARLPPQAPGVVVEETGGRVRMTITR